MGLGEQRALLVDDGDRLAREARPRAGRARSGPRPAPCPSGSAARTSCCSLTDDDRREPHDPRPFARRDLDRQRVEPADAAVERDGAEHGDPRDGLGHHLGALGGGGVVRLQPEAGLAGLQAAPRELDVCDPPRDEVRRDVDVVVDAAADELARALAGDRMLGVGGHRPSVVHGSDWRQSHRKSCGERSVRLAHEPQGAGHRRPLGGLRVGRSGGAVAKAVENGGTAEVIALSYGERGESGELWKQEGQTSRTSRASATTRLRPRRGRWARASAAWTWATTRCRSTPTALNEIADVIRAFAPDVLITHTDSRPVQPRPPGGLGRGRPRPRLSPPARASERLRHLAPPAALPVRAPPARAVQLHADDLRRHHVPSSSARRRRWPR